MARVTAEDCVRRVPNRFELVMIAAERTREIATGAALTIDRDNDKNPVVALREIADVTVDLEQLRDSLVRGHQKVVPVEEREDEIIELMEGEQGWVRPEGEIDVLSENHLIDSRDGEDLDLGADANIPESFDDDEENTGPRGEDDPGELNIEVIDPLPGEGEE